jgi:energy-converting hydrogenase B subunit D
LASRETAAFAAAGAEVMIGATQAVLLVLVAFGSMQVVRTRDPLNQAIAVSLYGLILALVFFVFQAPDVALSQIVVGAVALPLMIVLTLLKVKRNEQARAHAEKAGEERGEPAAEAGE